MRPSPLIAAPLVSWLAGWLAGWPAGWLAGRQAGWLAGWLTASLLQPDLKGTIVAQVCRSFVALPHLRSDHATLRNFASEWEVFLAACL